MLDQVLKYVRENRELIDSVIAAHGAPSADTYDNPDDERAMWVENDEGLYSDCFPELGHGLDAEVETLT